MMHAKQMYKFVIYSSMNNNLHVCECFFSLLFLFFVFLKKEEEGKEFMLSCQLVKVVQRKE